MERIITDRDGILSLIGAGTCIYADVFTEGGKGLLLMRVHYH